MSRRALITGGAGFLGSHVADLLLEKEYEITIVDDLSTGSRDNVPSAAEFVEADIASSDCLDLIKSGTFESVIHLAAQMDVRKSVADPLADARTNVLGTVAILEAIRSARRRPRLVFASTGGALYGDANNPPHRETLAKEPDSPYGITKVSAEYYIAYHSRTFGLDHLLLRLGNIYGPRQNPHGDAGVISIFLGRIFSDLPLKIFGTGEQTRDYVYVADAADAVFRALSCELPPTGGVNTRAVNIATGVPTSILTLAVELMKAAGKEVPLEFAPKRAGEQDHSSLDITKAKQLLGWQPNTSLLDGLASTAEWFRNDFKPLTVR